MYREFTKDGVRGSEGTEDSAKRGSKSSTSMNGLDSIVFRQVRSGMRVRDGLENVLCHQWNARQAMDCRLID